MVLLLFFNSEVVKEKMERIKSEASFWGPSPDRRCHAWSVHCYIPAAGNTTAPREKAGRTNEQASPQIDENYELPIQASLPPQDCSLPSQPGLCSDLGPGNPGASPRLPPPWQHARPRAPGVCVCRRAASSFPWLGTSGPPL